MTKPRESSRQAPRRSPSRTCSRGSTFPQLLVPKKKCLLSTRNKWPGASSPPLCRCCRNWAEWPGPLFLLYSSVGGLGRRLRLSTRSKWPGASSPPLRRCCPDWVEWPGPFSSSTRALAGFAAGYTFLAKNEMQGFSSESSRTGRFHELQIPGTLGEQTWARWALTLSPFAGLARQSTSLWVVVLWYEHHISPPLLCCCCPPDFG